MKTIISFTINKDLIKVFKKLTKEKYINKSQLIESLIVNWMAENVKQ